MYLDICMASSDYYATHLGICITSIVENDNLNSINMHILNNNISERNIEKLNALECKYDNLKIKFYDIHKFCKETNIDDILKKQLKGSNDFYNLLGISTYLRLFLQDILPNDIKKVLYLDADTIVLNSLEELFSIELNEKYAAGVVDIISNITKYFYEGDCKSTPFINAGVLLINLEKWREINFSKLALDFIQEYPNKNFLVDQNIINVICNEKILIADSKFNVMSEFFYVDYKKNIKLNSYFASVDKFYSLDEIENSLKNPVVVHFLSQVWDRPWISEMGIVKHMPKNPFNKCYHYYKSISPWRIEEIQKNKKSILEKVYYEIIRFITMHFPACILALLYYIKHKLS